jgi:hypothetical protein
VQSSPLNAIFSKLLPLLSPFSGMVPFLRKKLRQRAFDESSRLTTNKKRPNKAKLERFYNVINLPDGGGRFWWTLGL